MTKLETATHVFLIGLCCLAGGLLVEQRFFSPREDEFSAGDLVGHEVKLPGANWQVAPFSVLLQLSSTCQFCNQSMPFYRQLMLVRNAQAAKMPVIVASADAVTAMQKHLEEQQVAVDKVLHSRLEPLHSVTPTVYIVNSRGVVTRAFIGELDSSAQKELLAIIQRGR
ncbi:MAG TPA: hypothetical protein VLY04_24155 [Bryobacteraceae bacterium]|nr:hypothetical protein [Bryobacteraceae bacterium]